MNINKWIGTGNLTRDPEAINSATGGAKFGMAVNGDKYMKGEEEVQEVLFVEVVSWGPQSKVVLDYLKKGSKIAVEGKLCLETWEKDGEKRSKHTIKMTNFEFLSPKADGAGEGSSPAPAKKAAAPKKAGGKKATSNDAPPAAGDDMGDIAF